MRGLIIAGYGGHAGYAYAVAYELIKLGVELDILLPRGYDYLADRFRKLGEVYYATLPRKPLEPFYRGLHRWIKALIESLKLLRGKYDFVFASGSNFSIPASTTLKILRNQRIYTLEAVDHIYTKSKAVNALSKLGAVVFLHWEEQLKMYPDGVVVGPVYEPALYEPRNEGYVLVTTGTLGAREVFDALVQLELEKAVVQTGDVEPEQYFERKPQWVFFKYTSDLYKWIAGADVVVTHPGVTAATARLAYGKPLVLVYTKRHSKLFIREEVKALASKLNAAYLEEPTPDKLYEALEKARRLVKPRYKVGSLEIAKYIAHGDFN
ncbi:MAG: glycosyltransferase [Desulfurococcaceae archaeon]